MSTLGLYFSQMSSLLTFSIGWNLHNARAIEFSMSHEMKQILHYKLFTWYFWWKKVAQQGGVADIAGGGSHDSLLTQSISHCLQFAIAKSFIWHIAFSISFWNISASCFTEEGLKFISVQTLQAVWKFCEKFFSRLNKNTEEMALFFLTLILNTRVHIHSADISRNPTTSSISIKLLISAPPCLEMRLSSRQRDDLADVGLPCQSEPTRWTRPIERLCNKSQAGRIDVINNDGWHISISSHCTKMIFSVGIQ